MSHSQGFRNLEELKGQDSTKGGEGKVPPPHQDPLILGTNFSHYTRECIRLGFCDGKILKAVLAFILHAHRHLHVTFYLLLSEIVPASCCKTARLSYLPSPTLLKLDSK